MQENMPPDFEMEYDQHEVNCLDAPPIASLSIDEIEQLDEPVHPSNIQESLLQTRLKCFFLLSQ